jgi:hypothetical protein
MIKPLARICFGSHHSVIKHIQNDWLAGTWFFFYASLLSSFASLLYLIYSCRNANQLEIFIYSSSFVDMTIFTIGSAYFVAGCLFILITLSDCLSHLSLSVSPSLSRLSLSADPPRVLPDGSLQVLQGKEIQSPPRDQVSLTR